MILLLFLIPGGCAEFTGTSAGKIIPPPGPDCPLAGKWRVVQALGTGGDEEETTQSWVGRDAQFSSSAVAFDGHIWEELTCKIKRVNASNYLATKYISVPDVLVPKIQLADVVTIYAAANYLGEFMIVDEASMVAFIQDKALLLEKLSPDAGSMLNTAPEDAYGPHDVHNEETSGVLLGLRMPAESSFTYQTLWVAVDRRRLHPVLAAEHIFFPRTSGFWELKAKDIFTGDEAGNALMARNVATKTSGQTEDPMGISPAAQRINYTGNDYVVIEKESAGINKWQVLPVDKLASPTVIKIGDLLGEEGLKTYQAARKQAAAALGDKGVNQVEKDESGENFGLVRKNGYWLLVGRINYQHDGAAEKLDFELKTAPPANLVCDDTPVLNWHYVKNRVPDALDAFTSPAKDITLVRTKNKLAVYTIGAEQLAGTPLAEIELPEEAAIIMAEWATGFYVDNWEKAFLSYGARAFGQ